jgi:hypothetical protein
VFDKTVRNLAHLQYSASTARVLNLLRVFKAHGEEVEWRQQPMFRHPVLNRSIILKHRLRRDEFELFFDGRQTATKLIIPIDGNELKLGGRSVFVGQTNFDAVMASIFGDDWSQNCEEDLRLLDILNELPSLDPFLLRERLKRSGRFPARVYFEISDADVARMIRFVEAEIRRLIDLCFAEGGDAAEIGRRERGGARLVNKILSNTVDEETEPLRHTLRLEKRDYQEGVFCWKGFLYYKWTLRETMPQITRVAQSIGTARPRGPVDNDAKAYLEKARESLGYSILQITETAKRSLMVYDQAFGSLIDGQPQAFRDFLLSAPDMFTDLGERLGAVSHITSYWNFRFPSGRLPVVTVDELIDIFSDFESSLSFAEAHAPVSGTGRALAMAERRSNARHRH